MARKRSYTYVVTGRLPFPDDMLRYDDAKFATPADETAARERGLKRVTLTGSCYPTVGRWESFSWQVEEVR